MKVFSILLMIYGSVGVLFQTIYAFSRGFNMAASLGKATGFAICFLLPGILLYRKSSKKTIDSKDGQNKGDIDATKTEEPTKEKEGDKDKENRKT